MMMAAVLLVHLLLVRGDHSMAAYRYWLQFYCINSSFSVVVVIIVVVVVVVIVVVVYILIEEVLSSNHALWWSPSGTHIVYLTFNDTAVQSFQYPIYGPSSNVYTTIESLAYPKVSPTID